ncbi:MAG: DUF488 domain-containing protein [Bacteroidaceae bacterium]|nr:DUF488 domain-containing protein [Bacteroidaceae bacterium]
MITLYTIGFTKKTAERFFTLLKRAGVQKIVDIRLNNSSQLAGFAKGSDLQYFANAILGADYVHLTDLAPTKELLKSYQEREITWDGYVHVFSGLLEKRYIKEKYKAEDFDNCCFLCTEDTPEQCHRRLVVEFFKKNNPDKEIRIIHLY